MENNSLIQVNKLVKIFNKGIQQDERIVLDHFSCKISEKELFFITGPNGIGKTVFAKCLAGLMSFDSGEIIIGNCKFEKRIDRVEALKLGIEYLPQILPKPKNFTGYELLSLNYPPNGIFFRCANIRKAVQNISSKFNLEFDLPLDKSITDFTTSDIQKLYIIRALLSEARILILDEPTANLETQEAAKLGEMLEWLVKQSNLTALVIAQPQQQYALQKAKIKIFTPKGFENRSVEQIKISKQCKRLRKGIGWKFRMNLNSEEKINIDTGMIVSIRGPSIKTFYVVGEKIAACDPSLIEPIAPEKSWWDNEESAPPNPLIRYIPFDGIEQGLAIDLDLIDNCIINHWKNKNWIRFKIAIHRPSVKEFLLIPIIDALNISHSEEKFLVGNLSGGNRQRLIISRSCYGKVDLLVAGGIFRGLDTEGIDLVIRLLHKKAANDGMSVILLSTGPDKEVNVVEDLISDLQLKFLDGKLIHR